MLYCTTVGTLAWTVGQRPSARLPSRPPGLDSWLLFRPLGRRSWAQILGRPTPRGHTVDHGAAARHGGALWTAHVASPRTLLLPCAGPRARPTGHVSCAEVPHGCLAARARPCDAAASLHPRQPFASEAAACRMPLAASGSVERHARATRAGQPVSRSTRGCQAMEACTSTRALWWSWCARRPDACATSVL